MIERCHSCGAETPLSNTGVTHAYLDASPGCWARYGEVLAREYSDPTYFSVHALTVDAYALQHPGEESSKTTNSLNLHLVSLYAYYRKHVELHELSNLKSRLANFKIQFQWLPPPKDLGAITVNEIWSANTAQQHRERVIEWGEMVLDSWREHHGHIEEIYRFL
jgi:hypothetical protein